MGWLLLLLFCYVFVYGIVYLAQKLANPKSDYSDARLVCWVITIIVGIVWLARPWRF